MNKNCGSNKGGSVMLNSENICASLKANRDELSRRYGVTKIGLCGSFSRNEQRDSSDIDIVVELDSPNAFRSFLV